MQIRDIRLEQYGAWEHVDIPRLSPGVNVIFLDDGARAIDFSRFLHGMLVGFREKRGQTNAGSITFLDQSQRRNTVWRLDRHARADDTLRRDPGLQNESEGGTENEPGAGRELWSRCHGYFLMYSWITRSMGRAPMWMS